MSFGGRAASSSGCAIRPRGHETGSTGYIGRTPSSSPTGHYVMATAEHREPCESRGSCTVLGAPEGESPSGDSTCVTSIARVQRCVTVREMEVGPPGSAIRS
jgi:hypothetical protein